jgi:aromatic ring-opening dioxygenase catalytic subunit (LigB family)
MAQTTPMPAAFLARGSPMNALERNRYTDAWRAIGAAVPRPRAIYDFFCFPQPLFDVLCQYLMRAFSNRLS